MTPLPVLRSLSIAPVFNTKAVALETGVPADTFRAWERRYHVPQPQRTAGGHRLYSERDIAIIRWLRDRTEEGMNISQAVMLLMSAVVPVPMPTSTDARSGAQLMSELTMALTRFDVVRAECLFNEAFALYPFEDVLLSIVQPMMTEIGERWHRGEINIAIEHFATQFVRRKLSSLLNVFEHGVFRSTIVVGCAPGELHDLGALMIALFFVRRGWQVVYLGPQVPLPDLCDTLRMMNADAVCLSASTAESAMQLVEVARVLQAEFPHIHFGYGGRIFNADPALIPLIPGSFLGPDAYAASDIMGRLLARSPTSMPDE